MRDLSIHHDRYSKYCALEKNELRQKVGKTKGKLKQLRKQNLILKRLLVQNNISYQNALKKELGNKQTRQEDEFKVQMLE